MPNYRGSVVITTSYDVVANNIEAAKDIILETAADDVVDISMEAEIEIKHIEEIN